eukprot:15108077-Alexandrium_andersonii.AAC.1
MLGPEAEASGSREGLRIQRARRPRPLSGELLADCRSPGQWLQRLREAGGGAVRPNMRVIGELRRQIWEQTEAAAMADVQMGDPEVAVPAPWTYRVDRWPP